MAQLSVPAGAVNYQGSLLPNRVPMRMKPQNNAPDTIVAFGINWSTDGGAANAVHVDMGAGGVMPISQISAMYIDNTGSNVDVQFLFIDTQTRVTVPAKSSELVPISTNLVDFYVVASGAGAGDQTFANVFNFLPPPVALNETNIASAPPGVGVFNWSITSTHTVQVAAATLNGIITGMNIFIDNFVGGAAGGTITWLLQDGGGNRLAGGELFAPAGVTQANLLIFTQSNMSLPFHGGIQAVITLTGTAPASGQMTANIYVR